MLGAIQHWLSDPPPTSIFEVSEAGVALARLAPKSRFPESVVFQPLPEGLVESSPVRENIRNPQEFERVRSAYEALKDPRARARAALLAGDPWRPLPELLQESRPERRYLGPEPWLALLGALP